jgi:hypothetical protein
MKNLAPIFALSAAVLLFGCSTPKSAIPVPTSTGQPPVTTGQPPVVTPQNLAGDWQFSAKSAVPGNPPLTFAGGISLTGSMANAALHGNGSNCFDRLITVGLTGPVMTDTASLISTTTLTSTSVNGQVVTLEGKFINGTFAGTYTINGGCAAGDQGSITGVSINISDADAWGGIFTNSAQQTFKVAGDFGQSAIASSDGTFGITGTATFDTPCFNTKSLSSGSFPSGSFLLGTQVSLQIKTDNGTVAFLGTVDPLTGQISGSYTVTGGTCDQTGTAVLALSGQWDVH